MQKGIPSIVLIVFTLPSRSPVWQVTDRINLTQLLKRSTNQRLKSHLRDSTYNKFLTREHSNYNKINLPSMVLFSTGYYIRWQPKGEKYRLLYKRCGSSKKHGSDTLLWCSEEILLLFYCFKHPAGLIEEHCCREKAGIIWLHHFPIHCPRSHLGRLLALLGVSDLSAACLVPVTEGHLVQVGGSS